MSDKNNNAASRRNFANTAAQIQKPQVYPSCQLERQLEDYFGELLEQIAAQVTAFDEDKCFLTSLGRPLDKPYNGLVVQTKNREKVLVVEVQITRSEPKGLNTYNIHRFEFFVGCPDIDRNIPFATVPLGSLGLNSVDRRNLDRTVTDVLNSQDWFATKPVEIPFTPPIPKHGNDWLSYIARDAKPN